MISYYKKGYYRPQFQRDSFIDLCGQWEFIFDDNNEGEENKYYLKMSYIPSNSCVTINYKDTLVLRYGAKKGNFGRS